MNRTIGEDMKAVQSTLDKPPPFVFMKSWHYSEFDGESNSCQKTKCM
jgi:hypothetical protein